MAPLALSTVEWIVRVAVGLVGAVLFYVIGAGILRKFKIAPDEEVDPEQVVPVNQQYRCIVCGAEATMTAAQAGDEIAAPRHCREDMIPI